MRWPCDIFATNRKSCRQVDWGSGRLQRKKVKLVKVVGKPRLNSGNRSPVYCAAETTAGRQIYHKTGAEAEANNLRVHEGEAEAETKTFDCLESETGLSR